MRSAVDMARKVSGVTESPRPKRSSRKSASSSRSRLALSSMVCIRVSRITMPRSGNPLPRSNRAVSKASMPPKLQPPRR